MTYQNTNEARRILSGSLAVAAVVFVLVVGLGGGYMVGSANPVTNTVTNITTSVQTSSTWLTTTKQVTTSITQTTTLIQNHTVIVKGGNPAVVNLMVIPDYGNSGYDAFVQAGNVNSTIAPSDNPKPLNDNLTIPANVPVTIIITNLDTAVMANFTAQVTSPFTIYNDTDNGQVALQYAEGQSIRQMPVGHTFTISQLNLNIPIPPDTVVIFTYTFKPGVYHFVCETPCGEGMSASGYMNGYVVAA